MSLCSNIVNPIGYQGTVVLKFQSNATVFQRNLHNKGTQFFFDIITQFLAGYDVSKHLPAYIGIVNSSNESMLKRNVPVIGIVWGASASKDYTDDPENENPAGYLKLTASIINHDKRDGLNAEEVTLRLLDNDFNILCEVSNIQYESILGQISDTVDGIIEWTLKFSNPISNSNSNE